MAGKVYYLLKCIIHLLSGLLINTDHFRKSLAANVTAVALNLWSSPVAIGHKHVQLLVTDFFRHFTHEVVVMKIQVLYWRKVNAR